MARGDNKCRSCGEFAGSGHTCRTPTPPINVERPNTPEFAAVPDDFQERVNDRVARARETLLAEAERLTAEASSISPQTIWEADVEEARMRVRDGSVLRAYEVRDEDGNPIGVVTVERDYDAVSPRIFHADANIARLSIWRSTGTGVGSDLSEADTGIPQEGQRYTAETFLEAKAHAETVYGEGTLVIPLDIADSGDGFRVADGVDVANGNVYGVAVVPASVMRQYERYAQPSPAAGFSTKRDAAVRDARRAVQTEVAYYNEWFRNEGLAAVYKGVDGTTGRSGSMYGYSEPDAADTAAFFYVESDPVLGNEIK